MTEPYDSCSTCKTRHPKGWACLHELKVVQRSRTDLRRQLADLQAQVGRLEGALEQVAVMSHYKYPMRGKPLLLLEDIHRLATKGE